MPTDDDSSRRIAALEASLRRVSVQQELLDARLLAVERNRLFRLWNQLYRTAAGWYARLGSGDQYGGVADLRTPGDYLRFINRLERELATNAVSGKTRFSVRIEGTSDERKLSLDSLKAQRYSNWELVDTGSPQGDYVITVHAGDRLSPYALHFYAQALADASPAMVYADEDSIDNAGNRTRPLFKPAWSPTLHASTPYIGRAVAWRRDVYGRDFPAWDDAIHVPQVLYHAAAPTVIGHTAPQYATQADQMLSIIICSREARRVQECLTALRKTAAMPLEIIVVQHLESGDDQNMRGILDRFGGVCIDYRGPFDFARMNNLAAKKATAPALLFLNDDVIVADRGWDAAFMATLAQTNVGIVGVILEYPDGTVQHAGVVTGMGDAAGHCGRFQMSSELWPWLRMSRDVSAVTGAMLGIRSDVFREMGGFDETFPVNYNDVDLCLRARDKGLRVVCLNAGKIVHRESQTRVGGTLYQERDALYKRWATRLALPDEFYSPHLAASERIALRTADSPLKKLIAMR